MFGALLEKLMTQGVHMFEGEGPHGGRISVIAEIVAAAGHEEEVRVLLHGLAVSSQTESGCAVYHLLEDKSQPGYFSTYEEWEDLVALQAHLEGAKTKAALAEAKPLLKIDLKLTVLRKLL